MNLFSEVDKSLSSFNELKAIFLPLRAFAPYSLHQSLKWVSDFQACVQIVKGGSTKVELHDLSIRIFEVCITYNINFDIQWVPRDLNIIADGISKSLDTDELEVT